MANALADIDEFLYSCGLEVLHLRRLRRKRLSLKEVVFLNRWGNTMASYRIKCLVPHYFCYLH